MELVALTTTRKHTQYITESLKDIHLDLQYRTERTIDRDQPLKQLSPKAKSRGKTIIVITTTTPASASEPENKKQIFQLNAKALKVFRTMFFTPSPDATPGEVPWTDFLHAMVATGFEVEKLYGSVWQFRPHNLGVSRSIIFHEPHPSSKLPYTTARRYSGRLNRAYGWEGSIFTSL